MHFRAIDFHYTFFLQTYASSPQLGSSSYYLYYKDFKGILCCIMFLIYIYIYINLKMEGNTINITNNLCAKNYSIVQI